MKTPVAQIAPAPLGLPTTAAAALLRSSSILSLSPLYVAIFYSSALTETCLYTYLDPASAAPNAAANPRPCFIKPPSWAPSAFKEAVWRSL